MSDAEDLWKDEPPPILQATETEPGFVAERCPSCNAWMYDNREGYPPICLNACALAPHLRAMLADPIALRKHVGLEDL